VEAEEEVVQVMQVVAELEVIEKSFLNLVQED
jgi:hypothetical protein